MFETKYSIRCSPNLLFVNCVESFRVATVSVVSLVVDAVDVVVVHWQLSSWKGRDVANWMKSDA